MMDNYERVTVYNERNIKDIAAEFKSGCVLTLGSFDGVHIGHRELLRRLKEAALEAGLPAVAVTFSANDRPKQESKLLAQEPKKRELLFSLLGTGEREETPAFTVLLAANERGREILAKARRGAFPVLVRPADTASLGEGAKKQYEASARADELWATLTGQEAGVFMKAGPYIDGTGEG